MSTTFTWSELGNYIMFIWTKAQVPSEFLFRGFGILRIFSSFLKIFEPSDLIIYQKTKRGQVRSFWYSSKKLTIFVKFYPVKMISVWDPEISVIFKSCRFFSIGYDKISTFDHIWALATMTSRHISKNRHPAWANQKSN